MKYFGVLLVLVAALSSSGCSDGGAQSGAWLLARSKEEIGVPKGIVPSQIVFSRYWGGFGDSVAFIRIKGKGAAVSSYASHCQKRFNRHVAKGQGTCTIKIEDGSGGTSLPEGLLFTGGDIVYTHEPGQSVKYFIWFSSGTNESVSIYRTKS